MAGEVEPDDADAVAVALVEPGVAEQLPQPPAHPVGVAHRDHRLDIELISSSSILAAAASVPAAGSGRVFPPEAPAAVAIGTRMSPSAQCSTNTGPLIPPVLVREPGLAPAGAR